MTNLHSEYIDSDLQFSRNKERMDYLKKCMSYLLDVQLSLIFSEFPINSSHIVNIHFVLNVYHTIFTFMFSSYTTSQQNRSEIFSRPNLAICTFLQRHTKTRVYCQLSPKSKTQSVRGLLFAEPVLGACICHHTMYP